MVVSAQPRNFDYVMKDMNQNSPATLKEARRVAAEFGATIEIGDYQDHDQSTEITAVAPDGMMWEDTHSYFICESKFSYVKGSAAEAYANLIQRMKLGTTKKNFE